MFFKHQSLNANHLSNDGMLLCSLTLVLVITNITNKLISSPTLAPNLSAISSHIGGFLSLSLYSSILMSHRIGRHFTSLMRFTSNSHFCIAKYPYTQIEGRVQSHTAMIHLYSDWLTCKKPVRASRRECACRFRTGFPSVLFVSRTENPSSVAQLIHTRAVIHDGKHVREPRTGTPYGVPV